VLEAVTIGADSETLKWFWNRVSGSNERLKVLEALLKGADTETLQWFWNRVSGSNERLKILQAASGRVHGEVQKWFWNRASGSTERNILLGAIGGQSAVGAEEKLRDNKNMLGDKYSYDIFISHASEDKTDFVRPLASELVKRGIRVWYDEFTLSLGDSLRRSIDRGLASSRFGVVVLSNSFFSKEWPQKELDGLVAREDGKGKVILPIWHGLSKEQILKYSPILADRLAVSSERGVQFVVQQIMDAIGS
jgi:hypothetical protein